MDFGERPAADLDLPLEPGAGHAAVLGLEEVESLPEDGRELLLAHDEVAVGDGVAEAVLRHQAELAHVVLARVRQDQRRHLPGVEHLGEEGRSLLGGWQGGQISLS